VTIPQLQPSGRKREYNSYSDELRSQVIRGWLFTDKTHRELDEEVLGLDKKTSRGYQSMGVLHFLGLKADFHGLFNSIPESKQAALLNDANL
jgi:5-methylcytosine-specific restriction enzyme A